MPVPHLTALQSLEAAIRLGSFRAAGEELGVTPAAVGQQVRKLEEAIGRKLLIRSARGFEPTEAALRVSSGLAQGFGHLKSVMALLSDRGVERRLSVTVAPTIAEGWLTPRLAGFLRAFPDVDLRLDTTPYIFYRTSSDFDFALRYLAPNSGDGESETELFQEYLLPVCRADCAARLKRQEPGKPFGAVPLLHVDAETEDSEWPNWEAWGARYGVPIPPRRCGLKFSRSTLAIRAMRDGHGLHLSQLSIALPGLLTGELIAPFGALGRHRTGYPYRLVSWVQSRASRLHEAFADWVVSESESTARDIAAYLAGGAGVRTGPRQVSR